MNSKTKTTAKKEEATHALVPKLRFPEFRDAWEMTPIGEKVDLLSGYPFDGPEIGQDSSGVPLLRGINITEGRIRHTPEIDRYYTGETHGLEKYRVRLNDLVIGMDGSKVGKNSSLISDNDADALLIQRVARLRTSSPTLIQFIFQQIHSTTFHSYVDKINTSSGIPHISAKQIKDFTVGFPSPAEQQKIAECLSSVDELIAAQARKVDALKTHKIGLMQQLFPREGETQPRLRFPEFQNEWNDATLGDLCFNVSSGKDTRDTDGSFDLFGSTGVIGKTAKASYDTPHILVARVGANAGYLTKAGGRYGVTDNTLVISLRPVVSIDYIFHYLGNININKLIFGSGQPLITGSILKAQRVLVPCAAEQNKIANCLTSINDLIKSESDKLEALNIQKKGLVQQLFPCLEEVAS